MERPDPLYEVTDESDGFRVAFDLVADALVIADSNGHITEANSRVEQIFGYNRHELLGKPVGVLISDRLPTPSEAPNRVGRRSNGSEFPVELQRHLIETRRGRVLVWAFHDVSDREQAVKSTAYLAAIVESSEDSIIGTDLAGAIVSWNHGAETLFGYRAQEVIGQCISFLLPADVAADVIHRTLDRVKRDEKIERVRTRLRRKDGTSVDVAVIISPIKDRSGHLMGVSAIYRDITLTMRAEAELQVAKQRAEAANQAKSEFLANVSHEIRTPMNVLIGMSGLLMETPLTDEQEDYAHSIQRASESLLLVINDILDFSKIEAGKLDIDATDFAMEDLVDGVTGLMSEPTALKGLDLIAEVDPAIPPVVHADAGRLRQVLVNLIGNAIKFTERGEIHLRAFANATPAGPTLIFEVRDTGIGIAPEAQERIFAAFTQADGSTTRKFGGTGLGLTISKRLVELMGGEMGVQSALGEGSTFWLRIPLIPGSTGVLHAGFETHKLVGLKVLAVDDNETNRRIIKEQLRSLDVDGVLAENAIQAIVKVREAATFGRPFNVVLLDYGMPGMNGVDLARIIRSDAALTSTRLILMTSYAEKRCREAALDAGVDIVLHKPLRQSELARALSRATGLIGEQKPRLAAPVQADSTGARLLLVEDHPDNRTLALHILRKHGYQCDVATNGEEALNALTAKHYAAVLMDCQMPKMDGFKATAAIRRREGETRHTPIIAMTANAMTGDREKCLASGMDDYVSKPLRAETLIATIARWVKHQISAESTKNPIALRISRELRDLVPNFLDARRRDLTAISQALERNDTERIRVICHDMKGSGCGYGFAKITEIGRDMERAATDANLPTIQALLHSLADYIHRVDVVYE